MGTHLCLDALWQTDGVGGRTSQPHDCSAKWPGGQVPGCGHGREPASGQKTPYHDIMGTAR